MEPRPNLTKKDVKNIYNKYINFQKHHSSVAGYYNLKISCRI